MVWICRSTLVMSGPPRGYMNSQLELSGRNSKTSVMCFRILLDPSRRLSRSGRSSNCGIAVISLDVAATAS